MNAFKSFLDEFGMAVAGFFGALAAISVSQEERTFKGKIWFVINGSVSAYYLTGLISNYYQIGEGLSGGIGFAVGAFSGAMIGAITKAIKTADPFDIISKFAAIWRK